MRMTRTWRHLFFICLALLWLTGIFLGANWLPFITIGDALEEAAAFPVLVLHGVLALPFLLYLGWIISRHLPKVWRTGRKRMTGVPTAICMLLAVVTIPLLYYAGDETLRAWGVGTHFWAGALALPVLLLHFFDPLKTKK